MIQGIWLSLPLKFFEKVFFSFFVKILVFESYFVLNMKIFYLSQFKYNGRKGRHYIYINIFYH